MPLQSSDVPASALAAAMRTRQRAACRPEWERPRTSRLCAAASRSILPPAGAALVLPMASSAVGSTASGCEAGPPPEMASMSAWQALVRRRDRERSLSRRACSACLAPFCCVPLLPPRGSMVSSGAPETGCLPSRSYRGRACTERRGLPTRWPPATAPRQGRASPRHRISAYEPQRSHHSTLPVVTRRCV